MTDDTQRDPDPTIADVPAPGDVDDAPEPENDEVKEPDKPEQEE